MEWRSPPSELIFLEIPWKYRIPREFRSQMMEYVWNNVSFRSASASTNIQMLLQYGFVTPDNKNDYVVLQLAPPADRPDFARMLECVVYLLQPLAAMLV